VTFAPGRIIRIGAFYCDCCGEQERTSGCVRGYRCGCLFARCEVCRKCPRHHHRNCTEAIRAQVIALDADRARAIQALREKHHIR
jgi:hypothetical protein